MKSKSRHIVLFVLPLCFLLLQNVAAWGIDESHLDELAARYDSISMSRGWREASPSLHAYLSEAIRQGNTEHEARARVLRLYAFYNNGVYDSLYLCLPADLQFLADHEKWDFYYSCWSLRFERLQYENKIQTALYESEKMYEDACNRKFDYGIGIAAYQIGSCYQSLQRYEEAVSFGYEAEKKLRKQNNAGPLHNLYCSLSLALAGAHRFDELLSLADRWQAMWDEYARVNKIDIRQLDAYYINCHLARVRTYREKGDLKAARVHLEAARACAEGQRDVVWLQFLREESLLEEQSGNYEKALCLSDEYLQIQKKLDVSLGRPDAELVRARILRKLNRFEESVLLYERLVEVTDSIGRLDMAAQLDEVASLYKVDQYRLETSIKKQQLLFVSIGCGILTLVLLILAWGYVLIRRKNCLLCAQLEQQVFLLKQEEAIRRKKGGVCQPNGSFLMPVAAEFASSDPYRRLSDLLFEEKLHLSSDFSREVLLERLGINKNKLAEIIVAATGRNLMEYITELRLQEALLLMESQPDLPLMLVAEQVGFGAYSSFYRAFYKQYGVKPMNYRSYRKR